MPGSTPFAFELLTFLSTGSTLRPSATLSVVPTATSSSAVTATAVA